jgi:hypothetical protein
LPMGIVWSGIHRYRRPEALAGKSRTQPLLGGTLAASMPDRKQRRRLWTGERECECRTIGPQSRHRRSRIDSYLGFRTHPSIALSPPSIKRLKLMKSPLALPDRNSSAIHLYSNSLLLS